MGNRYEKATKTVQKREKISYLSMPKRGYRYEIATKTVQKRGKISYLSMPKRGYRYEIATKLFRDEKKIHTCRCPIGNRYKIGGEIGLRERKNRNMR